MKSTSKKSTGLLDGFGFQPVSPAPEVVTLPENGQTEQNRQSSQIQQNQQIRQNEQVQQMQQPLKEEKPKALKQAKRIQKCIEQGEVAEALQEAGVVKKPLDAPVDRRKASSKASEDVRTARVSVPMSEKERRFIYREARKHGMYLGQYVYALAVAAAEGKIELEDFLED